MCLVVHRCARCEHDHPGRRRAQPRSRRVRSRSFGVRRGTHFRPGAHTNASSLVLVVPRFPPTPQCGTGHTVGASSQWGRTSFTGARCGPRPFPLPPRPGTRTPGPAATGRRDRPGPDCRTRDRTGIGTGTARSPSGRQVGDVEYRFRPRGTADGFGPCSPESTRCAHGARLEPSTGGPEFGTKAGVRDPVDPAHHTLIATRASPTLSESSSPESIAQHSESRCSPRTVSAALDGFP